MPRRTSRPWNRFSSTLLCALALGCGDGSVSFPDGMGGSGGTSTGGSAGSGGSSIDTGGGGAATSGGGGAAGVAGGGSSGGGSGGASSVAGMGGALTMGGTSGSAGSSGGGTGGASGGGSGGTAPSGFAPCPVSGSCKILPLGDSITDGLTVMGGYRIHLFELAMQDGRDITFVGGSMNGPTTVAGKPFPRAHEGHSGWTIAQIDGIVPKPALDVMPHIVLLHIGTNDMYQGAAKADERLGTLIDQILQTLPDALLVVSTIIPFPGSSSNVTTYDAAVPKVVQARAQAGKHILFVDQFQGFPTSELADGVHPNADGYARMAGVWYSAISSYLH